MKKLLFLLLIMMITLPSYSAKKQHLPFAPKGKYGKLRTKQCKPTRQREAWIYRQWGRN